jgi:hypothetical protein
LTLPSALPPEGPEGPPEPIQRASAHARKHHIRQGSVNPSLNVRHCETTVTIRLGRLRSLLDVLALLHHAGLPTTDTAVADPELIEWRGGGPYDWNSTP